MGGPGAAVNGKVIRPATGSAQVVIPRGCQLLGFFVEVAGAIALYDAAASTNLPTSILSYTPAVLGWQPYPVDLVNGLVANCAASTTFVVA